MTASYRFRGLGWFLSGVIVALGFYLVSLQVAAERKHVADVARAIMTARRDIRSLETEFNTRANLAQLERWNGDVLALSAPRADQFVSDEAALARIDANQPGAPTRIENVAYVVPSMPRGNAVPAPTPAPNVAPVMVAPTPAIMPAPRLPAARPAFARTLLASVAPVRARPDGRGISHNAGRPRTQAVAMLDRSLLSDSTIGDLVSGARAEAAGLP